MGYYSRAPRKCAFCKEAILYIDYKNVEMLERHTNHLGKISPRRITGVCAYHQRKLATAVKRARIVALLPFVKE